jgi:hypothetical protein
MRPACASIHSAAAILIKNSPSPTGEPHENHEPQARQFFMAQYSSRCSSWSSFIDFLSSIFFIRLVASCLNANDQLLEGELGIFNAKTTSPSLRAIERASGGGLSYGGFISHHFYTMPGGNCETTPRGSIGAGSDADVWSRRSTAGLSWSQSRR